eukprot:1147155-Pelagomonas_calceolata.AAC.5
MFAHLALGRAAYFNPAGFWDSFRDYDGEPINIREHQDAYEFFTRLQPGCFGTAACTCTSAMCLCVLATSIATAARQIEVVPPAVPAANSTCFSMVSWCGVAAPCTLHIYKMDGHARDDCVRDDHGKGASTPLLWGDHAAWCPALLTL